MEGKGYLDFDLRFAKSEKGYSAEILQSPAGTAHGAFTLPFQDIEIENYLLKIGQRRAGMRRADSSENQAAREFGSKLFQSVFQGDVNAAFRKSFDAARTGDHGLRIRLHLADTPELADLPWEYLWQPQRREFLALSTETPIVRYFDLPETVKPLAVTPPLRVLVMLSNPSDVDCLDVEKEWQKLKEAVGYLEERKLLIVERLDKATLSKLQSRLRKNQYHVFHFVGHGSFDPVTQESVLALEDEDGRKRLVSGPDLGIYLRDEPALRLVLLNACEGARASRSDPFSGAAQSLVLKGIPAVIAMQFEVSDEAAIAMASGFYAALADDYPVDAALAEARKSVFAAGCNVEWGTPVLYLRAPDGRIFDVDKSSAPKPEASAKSTIVPPPPPLPSIVPPQPFVRLGPEQVPAVTRPEKRAPRRWTWFLTGMVLMFVAVMALGMWINSKKKHEKSVDADTTLASPSSTAAFAYEQTNSFTPPPVQSKYQPEPMNVPANIAQRSLLAPTATPNEDDSLKADLQSQETQQQAMSKMIDEMDKQARNAIANIRADDNPAATTPLQLPTVPLGPPAGFKIDFAGEWRVISKSPWEESRVHMEANGVFTGEARNATGQTRPLSGTWRYSPTTSLIEVWNADNSWFRGTLYTWGPGYYVTFPLGDVKSRALLPKRSGERAGSRCA